MARRWSTLQRAYDYPKNDVIIAGNTALGQVFGQDAWRGTPRNDFLPVRLCGRADVNWVSLKVGPGEERSFVAGAFTADGFEGVFEFQDNVVAMRIPEKNKALGGELLDRIGRHLEESSMYRGKALSIPGPTFIDLGPVDTERLVYNAKVKRDLRTHIWRLLKHRQSCRSAGIRLQRKILLSGPYGSGKSMATIWTAKKAPEQGWTVLYVEPTMDPSNIMEGALDFAKHYSPVVVIVEDFDREHLRGDSHAMGHLMNAIDGALSKIGDLLVLMTTNHPDRIAAGLQRPGRIDKFIDFSVFVAEDTIRLLRLHIPTVADDVDWKTVADACRGYSPAFVFEVANSAKLFAAEDTSPVTQAMLLEAAEDLRHQHRICTAEHVGFRTNLND